MRAYRKGHEVMQFADMVIMVNVIHGLVGFERPFSPLTKISNLFPEAKRFVFAEKLEEKFEIEFEREEIAAWGTMQSVIDSVMNQLTARRQTDDEKVEDVPTVVEAEQPVVKPPINRIEHKDVEDFRNGNYHLHNALNQYQQIALKSAIYPGKGTPFGLMYVALGLAESGEVQNKVKKGFRDDMWIEFYGAVSERGREVVFNPVTPARRDQIAKELRGLLWYLAATASELNLTLHDIALGNLEELCGRTDRGTLSGDGDDR